MNITIRRPPLPRWRVLPALGALLLIAGSLRAADIEHPKPRERIEDRTKIQELLIDHTLYGRYVGGQAWTEYHAADGRTAYRENNCVYQGHWWIAAGLVCFRYDAFNEGKPACFRMYRNGDRLDFDFDGGIGVWRLNAFSVERRQGNPEKLPLEGQSCVGV